MVEIAPSILSADITQLKDQIKTVEDAGAHYIHIDVMDGHFVPNITFGPVMVEAVKKVTDLPLDVHLMISDPSMFVEDFVNAGADILTVHQENNTHLNRLINRIKQYGIKAGVAINPATSEKTLEYIIKEIDLVLVMSVNPGFGGQKFIPEVLKKFSWIKANNPSVICEIDGGVNPENANIIGRAGANLLVAGSSIFGKPDISSALKDILQAANSLEV